MGRRWVVLAAWVLVATGTARAADDDARVRRIILSTRQLGAHGMGYNSVSMEQMSRKLRPVDVPVLIRLMKDREIRTGAAFGLASQCESAIEPLRKAAAEKKADFRESEEVMDLIGENDACPEQAKQDAQTAKVELAKLREAEEARELEEARKREANDQRIQENGLKMMDPQRRGELTLEERKEVFERSVKAAGLENPKTPEQKALVEKMYRTMVLGESDNKKKPN